MFLGVDGGGTKTAFALVDADGYVRARHAEGSAYYIEVGMEGAAAMLERGCRALQQHARPCGHELQPGTAGGDV